MGGHSTVTASDGYEFKITSRVSGQLSGAVLRTNEYCVRCGTEYGKPFHRCAFTIGNTVHSWADPIIELVKIEEPEIEKPEPEPSKIDGMPLPTKPSVFAWTGYRYCWLPLCDAVPGDAKCSGA